MKKNIVFVVCTIMVLCLSACGSNSHPKDDAKDNTTQLPNPFVDCETMEEASELAGFEFTVPESIDDYQMSAIRVMKNSMIEVIYQHDTDEITLRKALGDEDISGDYNDYKDINIVTVDDLKITMKGADQKVNVATWLNGDYTFSIRCSNKMTSDHILSIIENLQ